MVPGPAPRKRKAIRTGVSWPFRSPVPSWPWALTPQANSPSLVRANESLQPAVTPVAVTPAGSLTRTGLCRFLCVPSPSCPNSLLPQAYTAPEVVSARLWAQPALIALALVPLGRLTGTGMAEFLVCPLPRIPPRPIPHASTVPVLVSAIVSSQPARTALILVPLGSLTLTGVLRRLKLPSPTWPKVLLPQASSAPALVSATLWLQPARIEVTVTPAGIFTLTGARKSVVPLPLPSSPSLFVPQPRTETAAGAAGRGVLTARARPVRAWPRRSASRSGPRPPRGRLAPVQRRHGVPAVGTTAQGRLPERG